MRFVARAAVGSNFGLYLCVVVSGVATLANFKRELLHENVIFECDDVVRNVISLLLFCFENLR